MPCSASSTASYSFFSFWFIPPPPPPLSQLLRYALNCVYTCEHIEEGIEFRTAV
jgi:hypothetical protein